MAVIVGLFISFSWASDGSLTAAVWTQGLQFLGEGLLLSGIAFLLARSSGTLRGPEPRHVPRRNCRGSISGMNVDSHGLLREVDGAPVEPASVGQAVRRVEDGRIGSRERDAEIVDGFGPEPLDIGDGPFHQVGVALDAVERHELDRARTSQVFGTGGPGDFLLVHVVVDFGRRSGASRVEDRSDVSPYDSVLLPM